VPSRARSEPLLEWFLLNVLGSIEGEVVVFINGGVFFRSSVSMTKQIINITLLSDFVAKHLGTSKVLVEANNNILTIEPAPLDMADSTNQEVGVDTPLKSNYVDKTKAGALTLDDFKAMEISTKGFKFNREELYERK
jgi:hypothetical protein